MRRSRARVPRKTKEWSAFYTADAVTGDHEPVVLAPGTYFNEWIFDPTQLVDGWDIPTVMRMLFEFTIGYDPVAVGGFVNLQCGIYVAQETGGLPIPLNPLYDGWMSAFLWTGYPDYTGAPGLAGTGVGQVWRGIDVIDIGSRRKLPPGFGLAFIAVNQSNSFASVQVSMAGRILMAHA